MGVAGIEVKAAPGAPLGAIFGGITILTCLAVGVLGLDHLPVSLCVFKTFTGRPCLTCGTTRAFGRLYALDLPGALRMNPLASLGALGLVAWGLLDLAFLARGRVLTFEISPGGARLLRSGVVLALILNWAYLIAAGR
jgi:hypothetical protein